MPPKSETVLQLSFNSLFDGVPNFAHVVTPGADWLQFFKSESGSLKTLDLKTTQRAISLTYFSESQGVRAN